MGQEFRARSGRVVKVDENGTVVFDHVNGYLSPGSAMDAEEFFQAKRDLELGRWRWPENPDYVVYVDTSGAAIVFREQMPVGGILYRRDDTVVDMESEAARAYFEAHPERKPWQEAKQGEVWLLTYRGREAAFTADRREFNGADENGIFDCFEHSSEEITAGRKIWPEDAA